MATRALLNGRILSMDPVVPAPTVVIVREGRIEAVGDRDLLASYPDATLRDLGGRTLLPGFIDAHNHLSVAALHPLWADLSGASSMADVASALLAQARAEPAAGWVRGTGWNELQSPFPLTRRELDALKIERPVIVAHFGLHHCVVNSRALDELGIGRSTPDPDGGRIERDPEGEPTGLLIERAWAEAHARSLAAYADPDRWGDLIEERASSLLRHGITCIHDAACTPSAEAVYRALARAGRLPISVLVMPHPHRWFENCFPERLAGPPSGEGDEVLRVGPMKLFADGGVNSAIDLHVGGQRVTFGHHFPNLAVGVKQAIERGFRVAVHAIGNVGVERTLEAFRRAAPLVKHGDPAFRLEHATLATREQIRRLASLHVVAVVQPGFIDPYGRAHQRGLLPEFDEADWLPFQTLLEEGVPLAGSSDDPCAPLPPLITSRHGTLRSPDEGAPLGPDQAIPFEEWLRAYTIGAASAGGQQAERGSISPGKRADLVIVEGQLAREHRPDVVETWVQGEVVYARDE